MSVSVCLGEFIKPTKMLALKSENPLVSSTSGSHNEQFLCFNELRKEVDGDMEVLLRVYLFNHQNVLEEEERKRRRFLCLFDLKPR